MKIRKITTIETPYAGIGEPEYQKEKRRLQIELLKIQQRVVKKGYRMAVVFEGRDAAGKGSTIKRFVENLMPHHLNVVDLGVPTESESKFWFKRYEEHFPKPGNVTFFDRSWYNRALIEPTMGYCTEKRYKYFMNKVLQWEHRHIDQGLLLTKFYLSVDRDTQLYRFEARLSDPLTYWKFSENDLFARKKWEVFTHFKEQMFKHASSKKSPWVVISSNKKREARLTAMLYMIRSYGGSSFKPLTGEDVQNKHSIRVGGVKFSELSLQQIAVLKNLRDAEN